MNRVEPSSSPPEPTALVIALAACLAAGAIGGLLTAESVRTWYPTLVKPPLNPPDWVFGPVWTTLYVLMGVAVWLVWRRRRETEVSRALALFAVQLVLNVVWSGLFFTLRNPGAALVEVAVLWATILATLAAFRRIAPTAGLLMAPYAAWVTFATYLNAGLWWLNR